MSVKTAHPFLGKQDNKGIPGFTEEKQFTCIAGQGNLTAVQQPALPDSPK